MMETTKAMKRRRGETEIPWPLYFAGQGIDVGCGGDPIDLPNTVLFDKEQGDAQQLSNYYAEDLFSWLHASQCLEHLVSPVIAVKEWLHVVKPGGYLIITVPSWELYEKETWPSRFNADHKTAWSMIWANSWPQAGHSAPVIFVPFFLTLFKVKVLVCRQLDANYDYSLPAHIDQTLDPAAGVEPFIEFVLQKL